MGLDLFSSYESISWTSSAFLRTLSLLRFGNGINLGPGTHLRSACNSSLFLLSFSSFLFYVFPKDIWCLPGTFCAFSSSGLSSFGLLLFLPVNMPSSLMFLPVDMPSSSLFFPSMKSKLFL
jgi:hypothetical protein